MEASQTQPQTDRQPDAATLGALVVVLLSGLPPDQMAPMATAILAPFGATLASVTAALELLGPHLQHDLETDPASAAGFIARTATPRHAAYVVNAAKRLVRDPGSFKAERRYLMQHVAAERGRREAARQVDEEAGKYGNTLGWYARLDDHTSPGCRAQHGSNFNVLSPPLVEGHVAYPGCVHPSCRCRAGAPHRVAVGEPARVLVGAEAA